MENTPHTSPGPEDATTLDSLFAGSLTCRQHRHGYRFSVDAVLLAHFVRPGKGAALLDLGTGSGIIPLIVSYRSGKRLRRIVGIELQSGLAALARENFAGMPAAIRPALIEGDIREIKRLIAAESYDLVLCNPPFYPLGSGRRSRSEEEDLARHEVAGKLEDFLAAAAYAVKNRGTVALVYPAARSGELLLATAAKRLQAKRAQYVYSYPDHRQPARLLLLTCCKNGGGGLRVEPPLYIYDQKNGAFSEKMAHFYAPNSPEESRQSRADQG